MALDPEIEARVAKLTGSTPDAAAAAADRLAEAGPIGFDSPAITQAPVAIYAIDMSGRVRVWNDAATRMFGWNADETIGHVLPFLPLEEIDTAFESMEALVSGASFADADATWVRKDGTDVHVTTSASTLFDEDDRPVMIVAFALDVTDKENARRLLATNEHRWRTLLGNISDSVTVLDGNGAVKESTGEFTDVLGYDMDSWVERTSVDLIHPDDQALALERFQESLDNPGVELRDVFRTRHADGHYELIEYTARNVVDDPSINGIIVTSRNVTGVRQAEALLADEAAVLELIAQDAELEHTWPAICRMVEFHSSGHATILLLSPLRHHVKVGAGGSLPDAVRQHLTGTPLDTMHNPVAAAIDQRKPVVTADFAAIPPDPATRVLLEDAGLSSGWAAPIIDTRTDDVVGAIATFHREAREPSTHERNVVDVACHLAAIAMERDQVQRELFYQARHHALTGLPNRRSIIEMMEQALDRARRHKTQLAVLFIDLDRFKVVNDSLGHAAGDELLIGFGSRLKNLVRPTDYVGHFGADEFVVVLENISGVDDVRFVANRLDLALSEPFVVDTGEIFLSASIGVAVSVTGDDQSDTLLQQADAAMYRAKELGRDRLEVFDQAMRARATEQLRLDRELRLAVERSELKLHYQPEIDLETGRIVGVEALLRWQHPERGLVLPTEFIPAAEDTGLIVRIGRWVLEEAVLQARTWGDRVPGLRDFNVAVNLSARQLTSPDLIKNIERTLDTYSWPASHLTLELTESILIDDAEATLEVLNDLKRLGVKLAIDDFGTGFSSLSYLHRFPVDVVKVDRAFVTDVRADGDGSPVAAAVMHMARALGFKTAAEGVEDTDQLDGLRVLGCDLAQGFLFARPIPGDELELMLKAEPYW